MKRIKDFIHNTNDILLALIIVLIAAAVISWRLKLILAYPEKMAKESVHVSEETVETEPEESAPAETDSEDADN